MAKLYRPPKAYNNGEFLNSRDARILRILAEFLEPFKRFREQKIKDTIVFFGSARMVSPKEAKANLSKLKKNKASKRKIKEAEEAVSMSRYYNAAERLAYMITKWSMTLKPPRRFVICSGGGPGIMEASNRGAKRAKGLSIGLNISLPHEQYPNRFITKDLNFEFHYFFMRKFWFAYLAKALVIMPGGYGTLDEFFETVTLVQTKKIKKKMPIVVYDSKYWNSIIDLKRLYRKGMISKEDLNLFKVVDTVEEAFEFLKAELSKHYLNIPTSLLNHKNQKE
jgi:uncharacterized protein (TIGR00730 family)